MSCGIHQPQFVTLKKVVQESKDVFSLHLEKAPNLEMAPGQFNMLYAPGIGESAISLSKQNQDEIVHTIRAVGQVTRFLTSLTENMQIGIRGPFGTPWPLELLDHHEVIYIAGGIGLAPIRSLIDARKDKRNMTLLYGARKPEDMIFQDDLKHWQNSFKVEVIVDTASKGWRGHVGVLPSLLSNVLPQKKHCIVIMCGPEIMMRYCLIELQRHQFPAENIYLSMERHMTCGYGQCGRCQWGPYFICKDGPVMNYSKIEPFFYKSKL